MTVAQLWEAYAALILIGRSLFGHFKLALFIAAALHLPQCSLYNLLTTVNLALS